MQTVRDYYDSLAKDYDNNRFGNSYGRYIDSSERKILHEWLDQVTPSKVVDIGCGTGRLLGFCMTGLDSSLEMLKIAAVKFPDRRLFQANLPHLCPEVNTCFQVAICFHVLMHLDENIIQQSFGEIRQLVPIGGHLVFDIPSKDRREIRPRSPSSTSWHGSTAATRADIDRWMGEHWQFVERRGILFFPIHRLPAFMRNWLCAVDGWIGKTPLARYSSYHVYRLKRQS